MTTYREALNMSYGDWVTRQAALENIDRNDLENQIEVTPLRVEAGGFFGWAQDNAAKKFDKLAKPYEAVTDVRELSSFITGFLGASISSDYIIMGTGIKRKPKTQRAETSSRR